MRIIKTTSAFIATALFFYYLGYINREQTPTPPAQRGPVMPCSHIDVPEDHPVILRDAKGYYWTSPMTLDAWGACLRCHPGRWTQTQGEVCTQRLEFVQDKQFFPQRPATQKPE